MAQQTIHTRAGVVSESIREESREVDVVASTEALDSHGSIVKQDGIDLTRFLTNPIILWSHDRSSLPIGKANRCEVKDGRLEATIQFRKTQRAQEVFEAVKDGTIRGLSVGLMNVEAHLDGEDDEEPVYIVDKCELAEISFCAIPSNPETLVQTREAMIAEVRAAKKPVDEVKASEVEIVSTEAASETPAEDVELRSVLAKFGVTTIAELRAAHEESLLKVTTLEAKLDEFERAAIIDTLRREGKVTPHMENTYLPKLSMEGLRNFAECADVVLRKSEHVESDSVIPSDGQLRWRGKTWSELSVEESMELARENSHLSNRMRTQG